MTSITTKLLIIILLVISTGLCSSFFLNDKGAMCRIHHPYRCFSSWQHALNTHRLSRWGADGSYKRRNSIILNHQDKSIRRIQSSLRVHSQSNNDRSSITEQTTNDFKLIVPTVDDMEEIGAFFASMILSRSQIRNNNNNNNNSQLYTTTGLVVFLDGDLGAGKTVFSRGFVRYSTSNNLLQVTSPTYLLSNTYETVLPDDEEKENNSKSNP